MLFTLVVFPTIQHPHLKPRMVEVGIVRTTDLDHLQPLQPIKPVEQPEVPQVTQIAVPEPVAQPQAAPQPAPATDNCVTGYSTGDDYLNKIIAYESGGRSCATNPGGCFGLLQACPGAPLRDACGGNPDCQIAWFQSNKTGGRSWAEVWQHEIDYGWW